MTKTKATINSITTRIPKQTIELEYLKNILTSCNNVKSINSSTIIATSNDELKPIIGFSTQSVSDPSILFEGDNLISTRFQVGKLPICFNINPPAIPTTKLKKPEVMVKADHIGEYLQVKWPFATYYQFNFKQLYERMKNYIVSLDHVGVNINSDLMPSFQYQKMKKLVADASYLCDYPTQEEWPFIIPATKEEQKQGILLNRQRDPKFEFVYNFDYHYPEIQLDVQTSLGAEDMLALFPQPYGYHDSELEEGCYCVRVFIYTGWQHVSLRIDLRFDAGTASLTNWLIEKGKRLH